jgi:DNA-binding helix-hairpin-helix protein with protein kinase domain
MLGMELADSFLALHSQGLCYRDISFGNVFLQRTTGRPLICDTDNVGIDGASTSVVLGTRRFMAPEIVRREAVPGTATDLYSLAVLLFYVLMVGHPLVGRRELEFQPWDDHAESLLFGREPLFVFDPHDRRNEPLPELHGPVLTNWELYPEQIRNLFVEAFTHGLSDPVGGRVRESVWRAALARARDLVVRCPSCRKENFWNTTSRTGCWNCHAAIPTPMRFEVEGRPLVINGDTVLYRHHVALDYDFLTVVGRVAQHPEHPDRWGLRNETDLPWRARLAAGGIGEVLPGRSVALQPGTSVRVGDVEVRIAW